MRCVLRTCAAAARSRAGGPAGASSRGTLTGESRRQALPHPWPLRAACAGQLAPGRAGATLMTAHGAWARGAGTHTWGACACACALVCVGEGLLSSGVWAPGDATGGVPGVRRVGAAARLA